MGVPGLSPLVLALLLAARPDDPGTDLFTFDEGDAVESYAADGGAFRVWYTRDGVHAVPDDDDDGSGVPDHVEDVAAIYEEVLAAYTAFGFRAPLTDEDVGDNGGDALFDVYLVDFGFSADGSFRVDACVVGGARCAGYMIQENDFAGYGYPSTRYANRVLASHEFFHAVQAAYDFDQGAVIAEGTAVWATELFDPTLFDMEGFSSGYLEDTGQTLNIGGGGPVDDFTYGAGVFFQFLTERYAPELVLHLWEGVEDGAGGVDDPEWFAVLATLLEDEHGTTFADAFVEFATWNLFTGARADPSRSYENGDDYARVAMEDGRAPFFEDRLRVFPASAQYWAIDPDGADELVVRFVGEDDDVLDLQIGVALVDGSDVADPVFVDDPIAGETFDVGGADELVLMIADGRQDGESRRPGFCVAAPDDVDACVAEVRAERGDADADAGVADGGDDEPPPICACGSSTQGAPGPSSIALAAAVAALLRRRR